VAGGETSVEREKMRFVVGVRRRAGLADWALLLQCFGQKRTKEKIAWSWCVNRDHKIEGIFAKTVFRNARDAGAGQAGCCGRVLAAVV
jgi:hypothetical protein